MVHIWKRGEVHTLSWWGDRGIDGGMILKWIFKKWGGGIDWIDSEKWNYPTVSEKLTSCDS